MRGSRITRRRAVPIGAGLALCLSAAALAHAGVLAGAGSTIYACKLLPSGLLRVVHDSSSCRRHERALNWNTEGATGPAGPAGPQGPAGAVRSSRPTRTSWLCRAGRASGASGLRHRLTRRARRHLMRRRSGNARRRLRHYGYRCAHMRRLGRWWWRRWRWRRSDSHRQRVHDRRHRRRVERVRRDREHGHRGRPIYRGWKLVYRSAAGTSDVVLATVRRRHVARGRRRSSSSVARAMRADRPPTRAIRRASPRRAEASASETPTGTLVDSVGWGTATNAFVEEPWPQRLPRRRHRARARGESPTVTTRTTTPRTSCSTTHRRRRRRTASPTARAPAPRVRALAVGHRPRQSSCARSR